MNGSVWKPRAGEFSYGLVVGAWLVLSGCAVEGVDNIFGKTFEGGAPEGGTGQGGMPTPDTTKTGPDDTVTTTTDPTTDVTITVDVTTPTTEATTETVTTTGPAEEGPQVYCADQPCAVGEVCCYYQPSFGFDHCAAPGTCEPEPGWVQMSCNGPNDCEDGFECCGGWNEQMGWGTIACKSQCEATQYEICYDDPGTCDGGAASCMSSQALGQGYGYCSGG